MKGSHLANLAEGGYWIQSNVTEGRTSLQSLVQITLGKVLQDCWQQPVVCQLVCQLMFRDTKEWKD